MSFKVAPIPFPSFLHDMSNLKLILGLALFFAGLVVFSVWKEKLTALKEEDRTKFLMYNIVGGSWLFAVFAVCGGIYFFCDSIFRFTA